MNEREVLLAAAQDLRTNTTGDFVRLPATISSAIYDAGAKESGEVRYNAGKLAGRVWTEMYARILEEAARRLE